MVVWKKIGLGLLLFWAASINLHAADRIKIVTTFLPAYSVAANVAGNSAVVENLLPGAVNLHDYQLSPAEIRKLKSADIVLVNGLGMEDFLGKALANANARATVVRLSDGLGKELIREEGGANPHVWLNPGLLAHGVTNLLGALEKLDAKNASGYRSNASAYIKRLEKLDSELKAGLAPIQGVPFVTYHNAFPYFTRHYGLRLAGVVERTPEVNPSPREMSALAATIRKEKVRAIFTEPGEPSKLARQIAADHGIKLEELDPLETGELTPSAYEDGMRRNVQALLKTLQ